MTAPGTRRLVETRDGRLVEQVYHPCGRWYPDVDQRDPLGAARGIRNVLAAVVLTAVVWGVLWATANNPLVMGGLVLAVVIFASAAATKRTRR